MINLPWRTNLHAYKTLWLFPFFRNYPLTTNKTLSQGQAKIKHTYFTAYLILLHLTPQTWKYLSSSDKKWGTRTRCVFTIMYIKPMLMVVSPSSSFPPTWEFSTLPVLALTCKEANNLIREEMGCNVTPQSNSGIRAYQLFHSRLIMQLCALLPHHRLWYQF